MKRHMAVRILLVVGLLVWGLNQAAPSVAVAATTQETAIKQAVVKKGPAPLFPGPFSVPAQAKLGNRAKR